LRLLAKCSLDDSVRRLLQFTQLATLWGWLTQLYLYTGSSFPIRYINIKITFNSCLTNLLQSFEEWTKALDESYRVEVIYLDVRKSFDSVPHGRPVKKLKILGFTDVYLNWIFQFLSQGTMRAKVKGTASMWANELSGGISTTPVCEWSSWLCGQQCATLCKWCQDLDTTWHRWQQQLLESPKRSVLLVWQVAIEIEYTKVHNMPTSYYLRDGLQYNVLQIIGEERDLGVYQQTWNLACNPWKTHWTSLGRSIADSIFTLYVAVID